MRGFIVATARMGAAALIVLYDIVRCWRRGHLWREESPNPSWRPAVRKCERCKKVEVLSYAGQS